MNRIITILVTIFILLLLYIWISHVWGSDSPRHPRQMVDANQTEVSDDLMADADTSLATSSETTAQEQPLTTDEFATERKVDGAEEVKSEPVKPEPVVEKKVPETKKEELKKEAPKKEEPKKEPVTKKVTAPAPSKPVAAPIKPASNPVSSTATGGKHLVIAGNFTQRANAEQRVQELKKAGFPEAEVVEFDLSEYHTVCVGRFADVNEARRLVKKLKDYHKIDAYVRVGG
jgi:outer membrane biosynthesis protein TonB